MTEKLFICEKPSQAQDIAKVIGIVGRGDGYIDVAGGCKVSWAVGHLLETAEPHEYYPHWKQWRVEDLPLIPPDWKLKVSDRTKKQFNVLKKLIASAKEIVVATDTGREGELIAREVIYYCGFKGKISRLWFKSLSAPDVKKALVSLKSDADTKPLYYAALMRQQGDWIAGNSGTRLATNLFNEKNQVFSYGRVQSPTLAIVVERDRIIKNFVKEEYFKLKATVKTPRGDSFFMLHSPEEKIKTKAEADRRIKLAQSYKGPIKVNKTKEKDTPGVGYTLSTLQQEANIKFKFKAAHTLKIAQSLYEKKMTSYPRTDCAYMAEEQITEIDGVLNSIAATYPEGVKELKKQTIKVRKTLFDDSKVTDHSGIVPTTVPASDLTPDEAKIYYLICLKYLQIIGQDCEFNKTVALLDANGVPFKATGKEITIPGWTAIAANLSL